MRHDGIVLFVPEEVGAEGEGVGHDHRMPEAATIGNIHMIDEEFVLRQSASLLFFE